MVPKRLSCDLPPRYGDDVEATSGCPPSLLAFSPNTPRASLHKRVSYTHTSVVQSHTYHARVDMNKWHPRWQGTPLPELFSHRGPTFSAEFYCDYSTRCTLVFNLACTFFFFLNLSQCFKILELI